MELVWRPVVGHEDRYEVSRFGEVRHRYRRTIRKLSVGSSGYLLVSLSKPGRRAGNVTLNVHVLVAAAFIGPRPAGYDICHNDGDKTNNRADNLRYAPRVWNIREKWDHGTMARGDNVGGSKLTPEKVREIRCLHEMGATNPQIAEVFGISPPNVSQIVLRRTWSHIK